MQGFSAEAQLVRKVPPQWPAFLSHAEELLEEQQNGIFDHQSDALNEIVHDLDDMDMTMLEKHKYYAMGQLICGVARQLAEPETQSSVVETAVASIYRLACDRETTPRKRPVSDFMRTNIVNDAFTPTIHHAYDQLPKPTAVIGDILYETARVRRVMQDRYVPAHNLAPYCKTVAYKSGMVGMLQSAVGFSVIEIVGKLYSQGEQAQLDAPSAVIKAARKVCTLTLRQMNEVGGAAEWLEIGDGVTRFDPATGSNKVSSQIAAVTARDDRYVTRKTPIYCPAINVPGVLPGMFELVHDIAEQAQVKIDSINYER